ncbi:hypothetical protein PMAYCL1PPCAC_29654, partial [Pristionchus mayeri]
MRLVLVSLVVLCPLTTTVSTDLLIDSSQLNNISNNVVRRRIERKAEKEGEKSGNNGGNLASGNGVIYKDRLTPLDSSTDVIIEEESTWSLLKTVLFFLLITIGGVAVGVVVVLLCCCCIERRRLRRLTTEMSDGPDEIGGGANTLNRPLILVNNECDEIPFDPPSPGVHPLIERILPDPFSPVEYIPTPIN